MLGILIAVLAAPPLSNAAAKLERIAENPPLKVTAPRPFAGGDLILVERDRDDEAVPQQQRPGRETPPDPRHVVRLFEALAALPQTADPARLPWPAEPTEKHVETLDLGFGYGRHWYGRVSLPFAIEAKDALGLAGGDGIAALGLRGMRVTDDGRTASLCWSLMSLPSHQGAVLAELNRHDSRTYYDCLGLLSGNPSPAATQALLKAYWSPDAKARQNAAWSLIDPPYRPAARAAYVDMLRRDLQAGAAAAAVTEIGAREALPALDRLAANSHDFWTADIAWRSARKLRAEPPLAIEKPYRAYVDADRWSPRLLAPRNVPDVARLSLEDLFRIGKGGPYPANARALSLFLRLPKPVVATYKRRFALANSIRFIEGYERRLRASR